MNPREQFTHRCIALVEKLGTSLDKIRVYEDAYLYVEKALKGKKLLVCIKEDHPSVHKRTKIVEITAKGVIKPVHDLYLRVYNYVDIKLRYTKAPKASDKPKKKTSVKKPQVVVRRLTIE